MRLRGALFVVAFIVGAGCSGDDAEPATTPSPPTTATPPTGAATTSPSTTSVASSTTRDLAAPATTAATTTAPMCTLPEDGVHAISSGGAERTYVTRAPAPTAEGAVPVVVLLHGFASSAEEFSASSGVGDAAAAGGVLLVAPQGLGEPAGWEISNWATDAEFVNDVLDAVGADGCAATDRVWVGGHSAGSAFAAFFGCANVDRVAGVWLNAGLPPPLCTDRTPAVVVSHGTDDPVVPFAGGDQNASGGTFVLKPVPESAHEWAQRAGCFTVEARVGPLPVDEQTWRMCATGSFVRLYAVNGGGHTWPGAPGPAGPGESTQHLDAACLFIAFARTDGTVPLDTDTCA